MGIGDKVPHSSIEYRPEVDGLRAIAVLAVIFFHGEIPGFTGGFVGVDVFFVISGYLITSIILKEREKTGGFSLVGFYERRARRILPALFCVLLASIPFALLLLPPAELKDFAESLISTTFFTSNILFFMEAGYFSGPAQLKPLLHTWSLALEEQFYLLFPLLMMLGWRARQAYYVGILIVLGLGSLLLAHWGASAKPIATFYLLPTRGWELLVGVFVAYALRGPQPWPGTMTPHQSNAITALGLGAICVSIFWFDKETPFPSLYGLLPTLGTAVILLFAKPGQLVASLLSARPMIFMGLISYSLYLWHQPAFAFARLWTGQRLGPVEHVAVFGLVFGLSYLSWRFVELPFRSKRGFSRQRIFTLSGAVAMLVSFVGVIVLLTNGLSMRYPYPSKALLKTQDEHALYVTRYAPIYHWRPFQESDEREKLLIIGDSFAKDILNILIESWQHRTYQISMHTIAAACGNLMLQDYEAIREVVKPACLRPGSALYGNGRYEAPEVQALLAQADHVWLISNWANWLMPHLQTSLRNIRGVTSARITVFGPKEFYPPDSLSMLYLSPGERADIRTTPSMNYRKRYKALRQATNEVEFQDFLLMHCGETMHCPEFTENGDPLSFDGTHLTPEGARYFAKLLFSQEAP